MAVLQLFQKSFSRDEWPAIQITGDGQLACQAVNGAINCYSLTDPTAGKPFSSKSLACSMRAAPCPFLNPSLREVSALSSCVASIGRAASIKVRP